RLRVHILQAVLQVLRRQLVLVAPVVREEVQRLLEVAAAVQHVRLDGERGVHRRTREDFGARALLAERDQLAGVTLVAAGAVPVARRKAVERGLTRVPGDQLRLVLPAARARQPVDEDVVDRAFPVDLHRRLLRSSILATWVAVSTKAAGAAASLTRGRARIRRTGPASPPRPRRSAGCSGGHPPATPGQPACTTTPRAAPRSCSRWAAPRRRTRGSGSDGRRSGRPSRPRPRRSRALSTRAAGGSGGPTAHTPRGSRA